MATQMIPPNRIELEAFIIEEQTVIVSKILVSYINPYLEACSTTSYKSLINASLQANPINRQS